MMKLINRNSYIIISAALLTAVAFALSERFSPVWVAAVLVGLAVLLFGVHRLTATSTAGVVAGTAAEAADGKFTLVDFYSDY